VKELRVYILGVPFDYGIQLINGRPGARFGPKKIKEALCALIKNQKNLPSIHYENITPVKKNVQKTHERVTASVVKILKAGEVPIVIGGGHDISFGSVQALAIFYKKIGQINIDAHYDVRPVEGGKITSGTPFRRLLDGGFLSGKNFVELGIHSPKNLEEHRNYLVKKKATLIKLDYINRIGLEKSCDKALSIASKNTHAVAFDIDIDGVQKRFAPGCSAPGIQGFTKKQICTLAYRAGKNKHVQLFNLMEVSPVYDRKNKTVRLAAELIVCFMRGMNER